MSDAHRHRVNMLLEQVQRGSDPSRVVEAALAAHNSPRGRPGVQESIQLREFDKGDWMAFSGAEAAPDGTQPVIGEFRFDDESVQRLAELDQYSDPLDPDDFIATVTVDASGAQVILLDGWFAFGRNFMQGLAAVDALREPVSLRDLEQLGWRPEGFLGRNPYEVSIDSIDPATGDTISIPMTHSMRRMRAGESRGRR